MASDPTGPIDASRVTNCDASKCATHFFSIPASLLEKVEPILPGDYGSSDLWQEELRRSQSVGKWKSSIGRTGSSVIQYPNLLEEVEGVPVDMLQHLIAPDASVELLKLEVGIKDDLRREADVARVARGYIGWLLTNPIFLNEQDRLLAQYSVQLKSLSLESIQLAIVASDTERQQPAAEVTDTKLDELHTAFCNFFGRWRLQRLVAPDCPAPMTAFMVGEFPATLLRQFMQSGGLFFLPDITPIPSRDEFRRILVDAMATVREMSPHLSEWHEIVGARNPAKNQIARYDRVRKLYHYWRLLHQNHGPELAGKKEKLGRVFAEYLGVSEQSIAADLRIIRTRLGVGWENRRVNPI